MKIIRNALAPGFNMIECIDGKMKLLISEGGVSMLDGVGDLMIDLKPPKDASKLTDAKIKNIFKQALKQYNNFFKSESKKAPKKKLKKS